MAALVLKGQSEYMAALVLKGQSEYMAALVLKGQSEYMAALVLKGHIWRYDPLALTTLKYVYINHGDQRLFINLKSS